MPLRGGRRNQRKRGGGRKANRRNGPWKSLGGHNGARVPGVATADETDVNLKYVYSSYMTNGVGGSVGKEWTPNAAYDVDPALGSTATNGFDAYALMYSYYRVIGYRYKIEVVNRESDAVTVYCYNTNVSVIGSSLDVYAGNPYCAVAQLGPAGGGKNAHVFRGSIRCAKLLGSMEAETDATMRSLTTGVPSDLLFLSLFAQANAAATLANGVAYIVTITMHTRFYGRAFNSVASIADVRKRIDEIEEANEEHAMEKEKEKEKLRKKDSLKKVK